MEAQTVSHVGDIYGRPEKPGLVERVGNKLNEIEEGKKFGSTFDALKHPTKYIAYGVGCKFMGKKANFNMLSNTAKSLVVFGIMIGVGLLILGKFQATTDSNSSAYKEIGNVSALFSDLTTWGGIVLIVIMAYVIMRYLGVFD